MVEAAAVDDAPAGLRKYRDICATAPDEFGPQAMFWSVPAVDDFPRELHGMPIVVAGVVYSGDPDEGERLLAPVLDEIRWITGVGGQPARRRGIRGSGAGSCNGADGWVTAWEAVGMDEVHFVNTRFDPDVIGFHAIAQEMAAAVGYTATLSVDAALAQLLRLRVAQLNPCSYCLILHTAAARDAGLNPAKIAHLASWRESTMFAEDEIAALAYTEALTVFDVAAFAEQHDRLARFFDEKSVAEIAAVVINMNVWTRLKLAQGAVPVLEEVVPNDVGRS